MDTAKLFLNGSSQAVRLPKDFRFEGTEVFIKKMAQGVLLLPKNESSWDVWEQNLNNLSKGDDDFMIERNQPPAQERAGLDALFD